MWFLLAFGLTVWAGIASAAAPRTMYYLDVVQNGKKFSTVVALGQAWVVYENGRQNSYLITFEGQKGTSVAWYFKRCLKSNPNSCASKLEVQGRLISWCEAADVAPNTAMPTAEQCPDPAPEPEPEPPAPCPEDSPGVSFWPSGDRDKPVPSVVAPANTPGCVSGCFVKGVEVKSCKSYGSNPKVYCEWETVTTGARCTAADPQYENPPNETPARQDVPPFDSPQGPCPKGTVNGGISDTGLQRCIGTGSDPKNKPPAPPKIETEKTETSDDGTKTTTKTETITNSDGSKTTTTTVTITKPDGTKQVDQQKETSKTPTNAPGKDDSDKDDEKYDLCKQNPHLTICQNSSVAGKCGEISCSGDAIQCATLRAAAAMQCQQQKDLEDLAKAPGLGLGNAIAQGSDPMQGAIDNALKGTEIDLSKPSLDSTGFVGAGACLAPITMTVVGRPVTASFESVCQNIQPLRYAIMACAYILVYLLVSRSILQG